MYPPTSSAALAAALLLTGALGHDYPRQHRKIENGTTSPAVSNMKKLNVPEFSVRQIRNPHYKKKTGLEALLEAYAKYSAPLTPQLRTAMRINDLSTSVFKRQQTGTTQAIPPLGYDYEFVCPVNIGTPAQQLNLNFDSGSSDLWVFSTDTNSSLVNGQGVYDPTQSSTAVLKANYTFTIGYGDGNSAEGIVYDDDVSIGAASLTGMTVESATEVSEGFANDPYSSGILGLGMSSGNTVSPVRQLTFLDTIKTSLAAPLFTANLMHGIPGEYDFGYIDPAQYNGTIQYEAVDPTSIYWEFAATGYRVGDAPNASDPNSGYTTLPWRAIADTGTTLLLLPDNIVNEYYSGVPGSGYDNTWGGVLFPCSEANNLPDFTFGIGLYKGVLPGRYINYGGVNQTSCYGGIQSQGTLDFSIFGAMVLKAQYVVFDLGNLRLGFANKALVT